MADYHDDQSELYHFGVKGMKWGIRKTIQEVHESNKRDREFNKNDQSLLFNLGKASVYAKRGNHLAKKLEKKNTKYNAKSLKSNNPKARQRIENKQQKTASKYLEKIANYDTKARKYLDLAHKGQEKADQMINDAKKRGEILRFGTYSGVYYFAPKVDKGSKKHWYNDPEYTNKYSDTYNKMIEKNIRHNS